MIKVRCDRGEFCETMTRALNETGETGGGLYQVEVVNKNTLAWRLLGVRYKTHTRDRGVMLNFCPFCGTDVRSWMNS